MQPVLCKFLLSAACCRLHSLQQRNHLRPVFCDVKIEDGTIGENKIEELKEKLASVSDINEKLNITNEIAKMKKRMCQNEES